MSGEEVGFQNPINKMLWLPIGISVSKMVMFLKVPDEERVLLYFSFHSTSVSFFLGLWSSERSQDAILSSFTKEWRTYLRLFTVFPFIPKALNLQ